MCEAREQVRHLGHPPVGSASCPVTACPCFAAPAQGHLRHVSPPRACWAFENHRVHQIKICAVPKCAVRRVSRALRAAQPAVVLSGQRVARRRTCIAYPPYGDFGVCVRLVPLLRPEHAVAGIAQSRHDIAVLVENLVDGCRVDRHVGECRGDRLEARHGAQ